MIKKNDHNHFGSVFDVLLLIIFIYTDEDERQLLLAWKIQSVRNMSNKDNWEWVEVGYDVEVALANPYPISYIYVTCKDSQELIDPHLDNKCLAIGRSY